MSGAVPLIHIRDYPFLKLAKAIHVYPQVAMMSLVSGIAITAISQSSKGYVGVRCQYHLGKPPNTIVRTVRRYDTAMFTCLSILSR
jgi:hypothetical protein